MRVGEYCMVQASDAIWFVFIFIFVYPYIVQWWVDRKKNLYLRVLGRKDRAQVITLIHAPSRMSLLGLPFFKMIDLGDMEDVLDAIRLTPKNKPIDLVLHVTGGMVLTCAQIARALKAHPAHTRVIVPYYAMSGGTLVALGADEVVMAENAVLGPVDPQLLTFKGPVSLNALEKVAKKKGKSAQDDTFMLAELAAQATKQISDIIINLVSDRVGSANAKRIALFLTKGDKTHDYPITPQEAKKLGLPVSIGLRPEVYKLMETYRIFRQSSIDVLFR